MLSGLDKIAMAFAGAAVGLGFFGIGRRSVKALSLIGAVLGLSGAFWLIFRVAAGSAPIVESPGFVSLPRAQATLSTAVALGLAFHSTIVFLVCLADFRSADSRGEVNRFWVATPIVCAPAALPLAASEIALLYLAASVFVASLSEGHDSAFRVSRTFGAFAFVAAVIFRGVETGTTLLTFQLGTEGPSLTMLAIALVVPLISPSAKLCGGAQAHYLITAPFWLFAVVVLQIGVAPFGARPSALLAFILAILATWHGWNSLDARNSTDSRRSIFATLQALVIFQWATSSPVYSTLGVCAAFAFACLALEFRVEQDRSKWISSGVFFVAAFGVVLSFGCIVAHSIEHAMPLGPSIVGALNWTSLAMVLVSMAFLSSSLIASLREHSNAMKGVRGIIEVAIAALLAALAGCFSLRSNIFGDLRSNETLLYKFLEFKSSPHALSYSPMSLAIGFAVTSLSVVVGAALAPRRLSAPLKTVGRSFDFWRAFAFPFVIVEQAVEAILSALFQVRLFRSGGTEGAVPSPAVIVALIAAASSAVLLAVKRGASP